MAALALRLSALDLGRVPALPETPLPPLPVPFELAHPTRQRPPAPVVAGQIGLVELKLLGAPVGHAFTVVVERPPVVIDRERHRDDQHHKHHEHARSAQEAALQWLVAHEAEDRRGAATIPPSIALLFGNGWTAHATDRPACRRSSATFDA